MRKLFMTISLAFVTSFTTKAQASHPATQTDTIVRYLITSSATDFNNHRPPNPVGFRKVKLGHIKSADGGKQYLISGEFLTKEDKKEVWIPFITIKTSGYEQWIGTQAKTLIKSGSIFDDKKEDLSAALQSQLADLHKN
ncbi:hypothetical protein [Mucilaginibacter paludis]|uniref:Uncharacterized protein n=1 Tax=Mucilaginibacter paludis DSM 18603 TaxID=714943 RepID=H1Y8V9_9SPHI|nr:hypothetical protein [Mucilaginibacter paludis]EHQ28725.1 hypothetical protein Mucpa_4638 [Mucilaginibacter paludis DSM 18603]